MTHLPYRRLARALRARFLGEVVNTLWSEFGLSVALFFTRITRLLFRPHF